MFDGKEAVQAVKSDPVVARHYQEYGIDLKRLRAERAKGSEQGYVSYRVGNRIYWTKSKVQIGAGELVLTDGVNKIRGRCGNMISDHPQSPVLNMEPPARRMNEVDRMLRVGIAGDDRDAPPGPVMPQLALERDNGDESAPHAYAGETDSEAGPGGSSGSESGGGSFGASAFSSSGGGSGSGSGSGGGGGGSAGGGGGGAASGGGENGAGRAGSGELSAAGNGGGNTFDKGAEFAVASSDALSGAGESGSGMTFGEGGGGAGDKGILQAIGASLYGSGDGSGDGSGAFDGSGPGGWLLSNVAGGGLAGSLLDGAVDIKVLAASTLDGGAGTDGAGPVHPFSAAANMAARMLAGNPSDPGFNTQVGTADPSISSDSSGVIGRRETVRPDGATGTLSSLDGSTLRLTSEVPEPAPYVMFGTGVVCLVLARRARR